MAFYITAAITLLSIFSTTACSYTSLNNPILFGVSLFMEFLAEIGIQIIAISQVSSALELGLYLKDIRKDRKTQTEILIPNNNR